MPNFEGVFVSIPTFYNGRGEVAEAPLRDHLARLADSGVDGLVALASAADPALLTREEVRQLVDLILEEAEGERVFVALPPASTREAYALGRHVSDRGASGLLVCPPFGLPVTAAGFRAHVETLAQLDAPLLLGSPPGSLLQDADVVTDLASIEGVMGLVDLDPAHGVRPTDLRVGEGFSCFTNDEGLLALPSVPEGGFCGLVSELANMAPELLLQIQREGPSDEELRLLYDAVSALRTGPPGAALRHLLRTVEGIESGYRLPLLPLTAAEEERVEQLAAPLLRRVAETAEP
ncbi:MAG TPA: dihydrodipicolinate synthase family protein [Candidatus Thermoplasmatota archaeon]|nr:dihydrodipicolinate synthase family protein [Candidatus Thermoplasmatota archaeon]